MSTSRLLNTLIPQEQTPEDKLFRPLTPTINGVPNEFNVLENSIAEKCAEQNKKGKVNHALLQKIISLCDDYIALIPLEERKNYFYAKQLSQSQNDSEEVRKAKQQVENFDKHYPMAIEIFERQQHACRLLFLPEAETLAKSRWKLVAKYVNKENTGNMIGESFATEMHFQGRIDIYRWLSNVGQDLLSLKEAELEAKKQSRFNADKIHYPSPEDKAKFKVYFDDEHLLVRANLTKINSLQEDKNGDSIRISNIPSVHTLFAFTNDELFVLDKEMLLDNPNSDIRHSSLVGGTRALAGTMQIENGKLLMISNFSGHYKPSPEELTKVVKYLQSQGVDLSETKVRLLNEKTLSVDEFMKKYAKSQTPLFNIPSMHEELDGQRGQLNSDINKFINMLNIKGEVNHQNLSHLVDLCNQYIESIPVADRYNFQINPVLPANNKTFDETYPNAKAIFALQKRAISLGYLPECKTLAKSNWQHLLNAAGVGGKGKTMNPSYWSELGFRGQIDVYRWINDIGCYTMLSHREHQIKSASLRGLNAKRVYYANDEDQENLKVHVVEGRVLNQKDEKFNSEFLNPETHVVEKFSGMEADKTLYAFDGKELYILDKAIAFNHPDYLFHHSTLARGAKAIAGMIKVTDGQIQLISNDSGHYQPTPQDLVTVIKHLQEKGADLSKTKVDVVTMGEGYPKHTLMTIEKFMGKYNLDSVKHNDAAILKK